MQFAAKIISRVPFSSTIFSANSLVQNSAYVLYPNSFVSWAKLPHGSTAIAYPGLKFLIII